MNSYHFLNQTHSIFNNKFSKKNIFKNNLKANNSFFSISHKKLNQGDKNLKLSIDMTNNIFKFSNSKKYILNTDENIEKKINNKHKSVLSQDYYSFIYNNNKTRNLNLNSYSTKKKTKKRNNFSMRLKTRNSGFNFYSVNGNPNINKFMKIQTNTENKKFIVNKSKINNNSKEDEKVDNSNHKKIDRNKFLGLLKSNTIKNNELFENNKPLNLKLRKNPKKIYFETILPSPEENHFYIVNNIQKVNNLNNNIN